MRATPERLYEEDFYAWTRHQTAALRRWQSSRPNLDLDLADLARRLPTLYEQSRRRLPTTCPYTLAQVIGDW